MGRFLHRAGATDRGYSCASHGQPMTRYVDENAVENAVGARVIPKGPRPTANEDALAFLKTATCQNAGPSPRVQARLSVFPFSARLDCAKPDLKRAIDMPPLLRTYLVMGGLVKAIMRLVDRELNTPALFTGLEIGAKSHRRVHARQSWPFFFFRGAPGNRPPGIIALGSAALLD